MRHVAIANLDNKNQKSKVKVKNYPLILININYIVLTNAKLAAFVYT